MATIGEVCGDNRFELIAKAKEELIKRTNIESSPKEMDVIDNILFRMWQMGWLPNSQTDKACKKFDVSIKERALAKFPVRIVEIPDIDEGCPSWLTEDENAIKRHCYIAGATAQRKIDIEKACEWLKDNTKEYVEWGGYELVPAMLQNFYKAFRKAMEE